MSFMNQVIQDSIPIWDACVRTPFIQELANGTLPFAKFKGYMIQDSLYLKSYARVYGKAIYHSAALRDIQLYYDMLSFVTDTESAVRLNYLKQFRMTDDDIEHIAPLPENRAYIRFLMNAAEKADIPQIIMAVFPCMLSYSYIFQKVAKMPRSSRSRYADFIADYAEKGYADRCKQWCLFADEKCRTLDSKEKGRLLSTFRSASLLELDFWNMAYKEVK